MRVAQRYVRVVADSHAVVWYVQASSRLSKAASSALAESERTEGIVVSVATLLDLWYVTQTRQSVSADDLIRMRAKLDDSANVDLHVIDVSVPDPPHTSHRSVGPVHRGDGQGARTVVGDA